MMTCPHAKPFPGVIHCQLIGHGFAVAAAPCETCQTQTGGKAPDAKTLPPVLVEIAAGNLPMPKPVPATPLTPIQKIRNAAKAFAAFVRSGGKLLDAPTVAARLAVCDGCEHRQRFLRVDTCGICSCALRLKSQLPTEHCPKGKWPGDPVRRPCGTPCGG